MLARSKRRHRWLGLYLVVACFLLGGFVLRVWYGFDRPDETTGVGDRIVTISVWSAPGGGTDTWCVDSRGLVCTSEKRRDPSELVIALDREQIAAIRAEVEKIPQALRGTYTKCEGVCDGLYLDVAFAPDGRYRHDEIGSHMVYLKDMDPLFTLINRVVPPVWRLDYNERVKADYSPGMYSNVVRMSQSDMNRRASAVFFFEPPIKKNYVPEEELLPKEILGELANRFNSSN